MIIMRVLNRNTEHAPLLMNITTPKKYKAEEDNYQILYDDKKQVVFYLGGGGSRNPQPKRTESKHYTTYKAGERFDDPKYVTDD